MAKLVKLIAAAALIAGALASTPAAAQHHGHGGWHGGGWHGGGWHGGGWHRGGWGWGPGFGLGLGLGYGWGYPYYYAGDPYYAEPACGWTRVRVWRYGHWVIRRAWRCW
jgi:hypothetical protein